MVLVPVLLATDPAAASQDPAPAEVSTTIAAAEPLLDAPQRGSKAIRQLGDELGVAAARNDLRPAELRTLLRTDDSAWVDLKGSLYFVDPAPDSTPAGGAAPAQVAPLAETFALHSNPGSELTILLDFDGAQVSGTAWNMQSNVTPGTHTAWDPAGDGTAFNDDERVTLQQVWAMVAEDYAPFDVDVTTEDPGEAGMVRSSSDDTVYGTRVLVTPSDDPFLKICDRSCGGVAYLSVFDRVGTYTQPAWVFPQALGNNPKRVAEAATHEAGHNLGLDHDGTSASGYYRGHGVWAPIMGVGYDRPLVQWSQGSYAGANNQQDDLSVVGAYLGRRPDEASGSKATPASLPAGDGVIGTPDDVDAYLLGTCDPDTVVDVRPTAVAPNLDVRTVLYDAGGAQRAVAQPASGFGNGTTASGLGASMTVPTAGAGWVLTVDGGGQDDWMSSGYDDYGSLGAYTVSAPGCDGRVATAVPSVPDAPTAPTATRGDKSATVSWISPDEHGSPITAYTVIASPSGKAVTVPGGTNSAVVTGLTNGTAYTFKVVAANAAGASPASAWSAPVTPATTPSRVAKPTVRTDGRKAIMKWVVPADGGSAVTGYRVTVNGKARTRGADVRKLVLKRLKPGRYKVQVAATNALGIGPGSDITRFRMR